MTLPLVIAGLVLLLAGPGWFSGAATVGTILLIVGGVGLVIQLAMIVVALVVASKQGARIKERW